MEVSNSPSVHDMGLAFHESLLAVLKIRNGGDRTGFHKVTKWLVREVQAKRLEPSVFKELLLYAREASLPGVRNPNAVFMSVLKKEFGYDPKSL